MTDEWLAGFFDGEGCISGAMVFTATKYIKNPRVHLQITITQKDRGILEKIQEKYGGSIRQHTKGSKCWSIRWIGKTEMKNILCILAPYCICKKEQVLLALRFVDTLREENLGSKPLPANIHNERKEIFDGLRLCKYGHTVT